MQFAFFKKIIITPVGTQRAAAQKKFNERFAFYEYF